MRATLCEEAMRLARMLAQLAPREAEAQALQALLEIQASRMPARLDDQGQPILLMEQDRARWDRLLIGRGLEALERARALGGERGPYELQAAIAACHARARRPEDTDWPEIVALYDALAARMPSPVVALNRAVAVGMAYGAEEALPLVDALQADPAMQRYHLLHAARGDLLARLGRQDEARAEFEQAARMTGNERERHVMLRRARETLS
jgi:predicted RNA polymerase sigma factor